MNKVNVIKALPTYVDGIKQIKKAVGYARVSTESEEQDSSYSLQIQELEKDIKANSDYRYVGIFKDKATGTSAKYRNEFKLMIELARKKEIDVIVTKSISRFGRNLTETISIVRELRSLGIEIYFQKENISSLDDSFDFLFSVLASHAEEESNNISQNKLWSLSRQKRNGQNLTTNLYGYNIVNNEYLIVEDQAKIIRKIFDLYINGSTYKEIIAYLYNHKIPSPTGNTYWAKTTLEGMLKNEKFCGDMILGRDFTVNGKRRVNHGELTEQVFVQNNHIGIISKEIFSLAQKIRADRRKIHYGSTGEIKTSPYTGFVYSIKNEKNLRYTIERPKGKSGRNQTVIPTLYCNSQKPGTKRVSIQVKVLLDLLNQVTSEIKPKFNVISLPTFKELTLLSNSFVSHTSASSLSRKIIINDALNNLTSIRKLFNSNLDNSIDTYRKVYRKIFIEDNTISIKISFTSDESNSLDDYTLIHQTEFDYIKLFKQETYSVLIFMESSFTLHETKK